MNCIRLLAVLVLIISVLTVSACTPQPSDCSQDDVICVGLVTANNGIDDHGLNQAAWETLLYAQANTQFSRVDYIESIDARDWQKNIAFFADSGYDVIVTVGYNLSEATIAIAAEHPQIAFIGVDQHLDEGYPNIAAIIFVEEHAGFFAGALAAMITKSDKIGAVCETSGIPTVWRYCEGFRAGAQYVSEDIRIFVVYRESGSRDKIFNDPDWGRETALGLIDDEADAIFAFGGGTAEGALLAAAEHDTPIISVEDDLSFRLSDLLQPVILTSLIKNPDAQLSFLLLLATQGEMPTGTYTGQITYLPLQNMPQQTSTDVETRLEKIYEALINGEIEVDLSITE